MDILNQIIVSKKAEVEIAKQKIPLEILQQKINSKIYKSSYLSKKNTLQLIAEVKRKSPSKGIIRSQFDPLKIANEFVESGANAISVLTDEPFFGGSLEVLENIRKEASIPILRKDFIVDTYQIWETKFFQADIILLLANVLGEKLGQFLELSLELGLQPLIEVHNLAELELVLKVLDKISDQDFPILIGVNNRNLRTFEVSLENSINLKSQISDRYFSVAESGLQTFKDLELLEKAGFDGVLIGEGLFRNQYLIGYFSHK
jgi:indole-3-glycerol phosphate synthase